MYRWLATVGPKFCSYYGGFFYCVLNLEDLLREVPLNILCSRSRLKSRWPTSEN